MMIVVVTVPGNGDIPTHDMKGQQQGQDIDGFMFIQLLLILKNAFNFLRRHPCSRYGTDKGEWRAKNCVGPDGKKSLAHAGSTQFET